MKYLVPSLLIAALATSYTQAQSLDNKTRTDALKWLNEYKIKIAASKNKRVSTALDTLTRAAASDSAALELFKIAKKETDFKKRTKNEAEATAAYNNWERSQRDLLGRPAFKKALQLQCRWMLTGLKVAIAEKNKQPINPTAELLGIMEALASSKELLHFQEGFQSGGTIRNALLISDMKPKAWVDSPLNVAAVFNQILIPQAEESANIQTFRNTWLKRIDLEKRIVIDPRNERELEEEINNNKKGNGRDNKNNNQRKSFGIAGQRAGTALKDAGTELNSDKRKAREEKAADALVDLQWQMEVACFEFGDEKTAINNLKNIILSTKDPAILESRVTQLADLLEPKEKSTTTTNTTPKKAPHPMDDALFGGSDNAPAVNPFAANSDDEGEDVPAPAPQPSPNTPQPENTGGGSTDEWEL